MQNDTEADDIDGGEPRRRDVLATTGAVGASLLAGCVGGGSGGNDSPTSDEEDSSGTAGMNATWRTVALEAVRREETFTIESLDPPVVIQSFAVWCPKCEQQSRELTNLDDSITVVGLNTDPNEDAEKVRRHANDNGFDWRFAVAPTEMTESLVEEFGTTVTNAPSTPIIVVCEGGTTEFMAGSINPVAEIEAAAEC